MTIEEILKDISRKELAIIIRMRREENERMEIKLDMLLDRKFEIIREAGMMLGEFKGIGIIEND